VVGGGCSAPALQQPRQGLPSIATPVAAALPSHPPSAERRASRACYQRQRGTPHPHPPPSPPPLTLHLHHHTSSGHCQTPGFFLARGFPPWGAAGVHSHLTLSHASYHQLTRPIVHRWSWTPVIYPHRRRSRRTAAHMILFTTSSIATLLEPPCCLDTGPGMLPQCCRRGGRGILGSTTTPPTPPTPPCLLTTHLAHLRPLPRRRSSSDRQWYPPTPSDTIDQAPPP
jgi:hypothetical protein